MVGIRFTSAVVAAASLATSVLADVDPIVIKGSKFFYKTNGTEFFIKGVAYQQNVGGNGTTSANVNYVDPLTDVDGCKRDIPNLQQLQTNTIRVYAIDPTKDHKQCMQMLQDAGIYVVADLSAPNASINRDKPTWDAELYARYASVVDTLAPFNNVLGFFAGNEVSNNATNVGAIPFVKAAARDMKAYIKRRGYRAIGVGYAADDDATIRAPLANYINCGPSDSSVDFFGYNIYSWCGHSDYQTSGYADRTAEYKNYSIPAFFAEYGCNDPAPRVFEETLALYGENMTSVWSGGIVYEYFQEANKFGLVSMDGTTASKLPDFSALSSQIAKATPTGPNSASYNPTNTAARSCPTTDASWSAATALPPTPNQQLCSCMVANLTCIPKTSVDAKNYQALFDTACGLSKDLCTGITANGTTGLYGAYSVCNATERLSWALDAYYQQQKMSNSANTNACDFNAQATTQTPTAPSGECAALVSQAGSAGTGSVTSKPTATSAVGGGSGSGSGSGAAASSSSGVAGAVTVPKFDFGLLTMGVYVSVAAMVGAGMVLL